MEGRVRERTATGGPPARHFLQTRRSGKLREANRERHGLDLELNGGNRSMQRSHWKLRGAAHLNRTGAFILIPAWRTPRRFGSRSVTLALRRTTAMLLASGWRLGHGRSLTTQVEAGDAALTERKLRQHQGEYEEHPDQRGQEAAGRWWISAHSLHGSDHGGNCRASQGADLERPRREARIRKPAIPTTAPMASETFMGSPGKSPVVVPNRTSTSEKARRPARLCREK